MSDLNSRHNRLVWFDIPVADLDRSARFYGAVLGVPIHRQSYGDFSFCVVEHQEGNGGCLVEQPDWIAPQGGILVYLNAEGRIRDAVSQVEAHGGQVVEDVKAIGPHGFRALIRDSEGNRLALHSSVDA